MAVNIEFVNNSESNQLFLYSDLHLDVILEYVTGNELGKGVNVNDIRIDYDKAAILNSIINILTTSPLQKILNPEFGLDLRQFLFEPISKITGRIIGEKIFYTFLKYEPRVVIDKIELTAQEDDNQYTINILFSIPRLNASGITLKGRLNSDGYEIV